MHTYPIRCELDAGRPTPPKIMERGVPPTRPGTWGGGCPPRTRTKGEGGGGAPPLSGFGMPAGFAREIQVCSCGVSDGGFLPAVVFCSWLWAGPGRRGEGVPPCCSGTRVGGWPPTKRTRGEGGDLPTPPPLFLKAGPVPAISR